MEIIFPRLKPFLQMGVVVMETQMSHREWLDSWKLNKVVSPSTILLLLKKNETIDM